MRRRNFTDLRLSYTRDVHGACSICREVQRLGILDRDLDRQICRDCAPACIVAAVVLNRAEMPAPDAALILQNP